MNVFVLCTGRNGSYTFFKACEHIENFTVGHEEYTKKLGDDRFDFPRDHIEIDNRLTWHIGEIDSKFGDDAFYVYLKRNKSKVRDSFKKRFKKHDSIISTYSQSIKKTPPEELNKNERTQLAEDYIETVESNVDLLWKDKSNTLTIELENINEGFSDFWDRINAEGNLNQALAEFQKSYNASKKNTLKEFLYKIKQTLKRWRFLIFEKA